MTASAIAKKIGIFESNEKTSIEIANDEKISLIQAIDKTNAIVVNGQMLTEVA